MNWALQEVVESFRNARPSVLGLARQGQGERSEDEPAGKKRKVDHGGGKDAVGDSVEEGRRTRSWSKRDRPTETSAVAEVVEDIQDDEYIPGMSSTYCGFV